VTDRSGTRGALQEQLAYYRARADEYDQWWLRADRYDRDREGWQADIAAVFEALDRFAPRGRILELACGTGIWSERLLGYSADLTLVDGAPEMLARAAARLEPRRVRYIEADLFEWVPAERFDTLFFSFWLSHVPPPLFAAFWRLVDACLAPGGRVFFVDSQREETSTAVDHVLPAQGSDVARRRLNDGREFDVFKIFYDPAELTERLWALGWRFRVRETSRYFIYADGGREA
jgi:demethylmenaquinone methyltransferase/2-methoxy-6-polyprenyl-1,4-benzoquinol methylase